MPKARTVWRCQQCGATAPKWFGKCADCGEFGTFVEEAEQPFTEAGPSRPAMTTVSLASAESVDEDRLSTAIQEFDRVLGGGFVTGSLALLGGEPGIGKSTLLLQAAAGVGDSGGRVVYVCGEESPGQIGIRARRLALPTDGIDLLPEVDIAVVERHVREVLPSLLVVDSIQTAFDPDLSSAPGSVGQVRACTARLMRIAKDLGVTTVVIGHVTKDGAIAGPRVLEHMVDVVLYFEGDRDHAYRVVRAVKNRFGSVSEIGVFEMGAAGLTGVGDPSAVFLAERSDSTPGSAVMVAMEGSRPLLVEVQALVTPSYLQVPRRLATGIDNARLLQLLAVLERRADLSFGSQDVFVTVAGGVKVGEPAVDLPLALALVSALKDRPLPSDLAAFGEIGLTGQVRSVSHSEARMREAAQQGYARVAANVPNRVKAADGVDLMHAKMVRDVFGILG